MPILVKNKGSKPKKARSRRSSLSNSDYLDDDEALKQVSVDIILNTYNFVLPD